MPTFDKSEGALLYVQVSDFVREKIYSKDWGVDEPIPSEHELMGMLHLSRGTVQKGIRQLVDEGPAARAGHLCGAAGHGASQQQPAALLRRVHERPGRGVRDQGRGAPC